MGEIYRQGDILLERVDKFPGKVQFRGFQLSLTGETGNPHVLPGKVYSIPGNVGIPLQQFVEVGKGGAVMVHPEHPDMLVPVGLFRVRRVRSYIPDGTRDVVD